MEPKPIYLIEQNDGTLTVEEPQPAPHGTSIYLHGRTPARTPASFKFDPGLALEIATLRGLADAMGAAEIAVLRGVEAPDVYWRHGNEYGRLQAGDAGTLVLIRFAAHDGGKPAEHWML